MPMNLKTTKRNSLYVSIATVLGALLFSRQVHMLLHQQQGQTLVTLQQHRM